MAHHPPQPPTQISPVLPLVFILLAGLIFYWSQNDKDSRTSENLGTQLKIRIDDVTEAKVNKYLQETSHKLETQRLKSEIENQILRPKIGDLVPVPKEKSEPLAIQAPEDQDQVSLHKRLDPDISPADESPRTQIETTLAEQQRLQEYDRQYRAEYIKQFIANAKAKGWIVRVNKDGVVTSAVEDPNFKNEETEINLFKQSTLSPTGND